MNSIVFVETNKFGSSIDGIKTARSLGYYIHLLTSKNQFVEKKEELPEIDEIHLINLDDEENIYNKLVQINSDQDIDIIISFVDSYVTVAAKMHNVFCNKNISDNAFYIMEDKLLTREHLKNKPFSPFFYINKINQPIINLISKMNNLYPVILKSPVSTGSKDVYFIKTDYQLKNRINYLRGIYPNGDLLIEEYLDGPQYLIEVIVHDGNIHIVSVIEQVITKKSKFIVTGYCINPEIEEGIYIGIKKVTYQILNDFGLKNGNCHLELRIVNGEWKLIEANPRISGGTMNTLIKAAYGINYAEQILKVYRGEEPSLNRQYQNCIYAHFITVDDIGELLKVTGIDRAKEVPGIIEVNIKSKLGQILSPPLSMGHRYGYVIAKGKSKEEAKSIAFQASQHIKFHLSPITD